MQQTLTTLKVFERYLWRMVKTVGVFVFVLLAVKFFFLGTGRVNGVSMEPNFRDDDLFFINKMVYLTRPPARSEAVQVIMPSEKKLLIKRVIGLPGETVVIKRGKVFIKKSRDAEEQELLEPYFKKAPFTGVAGQKDGIRYTMGANDYFILGDNRGKSTDSRVYGPVPRARILGKVMGKI